jgi:hypothetical protein
VVAHVQRYVRQKGQGWESGRRPDVEDGLTTFDKMALKTCLRMLCNGRDVPLTADVHEALRIEAEETRVDTAAERQGYDRQGARPVISLSTGAPMDDLLQDVAGVQDKAAVDVRIREATGQGVPTPGPAGEAGVEWIPRIEAAIVAQGDDVAKWWRWAENLLKKSAIAFSVADYERIMQAVQTAAATKKQGQTVTRHAPTEGATGASWGPESPDLFKEGEARAEDYGE